MTKPLSVLLITSLCVILAPSSLLAKAKELVVRDSNGVQVGVTVGQEFVNDVTVALTENNLTFVIRVSRDRFIGNSDALLFESTDCTGDPYLPFFPNFLLPRVAIAAPGQTAYVGGGGALTINRQSFLFQGACTSVGPASVSVQPAVVVVDLSDRFTPPFTAGLK